LILAGCAEPWRHRQGSGLALTARRHRWLLRTGDLPVLGFSKHL